MQKFRDEFRGASLLMVTFQRDGNTIHLRLFIERAATHFRWEWEEWQGMTRIAEWMEDGDRWESSNILEVQSAIGMQMRTETDWRTSL